MKRNTLVVSDVIAGVALALIVIAIPVAAFLGFGAVATALLSNAEWQMANVSLGAMGVCVVIVTVELILARVLRTR